MSHHWSDGLVSYAGVTGQGLQQELKRLKIFYDQSPFILCILPNVFSSQLFFSGIHLACFLHFLHVVKAKHQAAESQECGLRFSHQFCAAYSVDFWVVKCRYIYYYYTGKCSSPFLTQLGPTSVSMYELYSSGESKIV